jgi:hypothetical protein
MRDKLPAIDTLAGGRRFPTNGTNVGKDRSGCLDLIA